VLTPGRRDEFLEKTILSNFDMMLLEDCEHIIYGAHPRKKIWF
jgi:hypothetical protein